MESLERTRNRINEIDREMAKLWCERMNAVREVTEYKKKMSMPVLDAAREASLLEKNLSYIPEELRDYYVEFQRGVVGVSKTYQRGEIDREPDIIPLFLGDRSYDILVRRGSLSAAGSYMDLDRKVLIVTDDGVPAEYAETVSEQCGSPVTVTLPQGERTKCFESFRTLLLKMLDSGFTRKDCVVAVGGGVIGDLAGFAAAAYMRGIDFYNIPTTTLSQIDSSIGGKVAIDLEGYKNTVGAFWQPKFVLIDPDVLKTLDDRQVSAGLAEAVKMSLCFDGELFDMFEHGGCDIDEIIRRSLMIKKSVVEKDETENSLRKVLNFGHTIGHGIEAAENGRLIHGECVALGMLPMCSFDVRARLKKVLESLKLPTKITADPAKVKLAYSHDKKSEGSGVSIVKVNEPGKFEIEKLTFSELDSLFDRYLEDEQ